MTAATLPDAGPPRRPIRRRSVSTTAFVVLAVVIWLLALRIVGDTLRTVWPLVSPLPWFDDWATMRLFRAWITGRQSLWSALSTQNNEHRILVPRLVFFADDLWFQARGRLPVALAFVVQALHALLLIRLLSPGRRPVRWAVAGLILALMSGLRQHENFQFGFQLCFIVVFAGASLSVLSFAAALERARAALPIAPTIAASFVVSAVAAFTMANGLLVPLVLACQAAAARLRPALVSLCAGWAVLLLVVYLHGYAPVAHHLSPLDALAHPLGVALYVAAYLGSVVPADAPIAAVALGSLGVVATGFAVARSASSPARPASLALVGIIVFVAATAAVTASGRFENGLEQALSSRYATGSAVFWSAHLVYWCTSPPAWATRTARGRRVAGGGVAAAMLALWMAILAAQDVAKPAVYEAAFRKNDAANLLLLGLEDRAAILQVSWDVGEVASLVPFMKDRGISIFATPEARWPGRPVSAILPIAPFSACAGGIASAAPDPSLRDDALRLTGSARDGARGIRRVLLVDAQGIVVGLGSGGLPGLGPRDWRGYATGSGGRALAAYALLGDGALCRFAAEP